MKLITLLALIIPSLGLAASLTIGTYNIRNFDYDDRYHIKTNKSELAKIIKETGADLMAVQEINNTSEFGAFVDAQFDDFDSALSECGGAHGQRLGFMFNTKKLKLISFDEDLALSNPGQRGACNGGSRPAAIALFEKIDTKQKFYAVSVHLKSGGQNASIIKRNKQFNEIQKILKILQSNSGVKDFVVAGDMNTTNYNVRGSDYKTLQSLATAIGATDLAKSLPCTSYWWGGSDDGIETPSILDHVLVSSGLIKIAVQPKVGGHCAAVSCQEMPEARLGMSYSNVSDHCPVSAQIQ